ncbi:MAG: M48 family metallopeptidase [Dehalococcoidia bacterium]|nr:M48 family metallopeptidase [Dehalococcoidia bacterium]
MAELDPQRQEKAKDYARRMRRLSFLELGLGFFFVLILLFTPLSLSLRNLLDFPKPLQVALYFATLMICLGIVSAPLSFYGGFVLPRRFGISTQNLRGWLLDEAKGGVLGLLLGIGVMVFIYWLLGSFPDLWWLFAACFLILLTVVMTNLAPIIIVPLFYKLEPLADEGLMERLVRLAERAKTKVRGVFTINLSSKATSGNAALMGLGNTRRIVLGDTILDRYSPEEIEAIMAHELGHHVHRDIAKLIALQSATILAGFYLVHLVLRVSVPYFDFNGIDDVAAFPLLALVAGAFALLLEPLSNAYSRYQEGSADEYALALTDNPEGFITVMTKLTNQNLSEAQPSRWVELLFYDHPPYFKRVARAQHYEDNLVDSEGQSRAE